MVFSSYLMASGVQDHPPDPPQGPHDERGAGESRGEERRAGARRDEERGVQLDFGGSPLDPSDLKHLKVLDVLNSRSPFGVGGFQRLRLMPPTP